MRRFSSYQLLIEVISKFKAYFVFWTLCQQLQLSHDTKERVKSLTEAVANIVSKGCDCDYSPAYISKPTLQCSSVDPDSTNILLYQARVQEGGEAPIDYRRLVTILEEAKGTSFSLMVRETK